MDESQSQPAIKDSPAESSQDSGRIYAPGKVAILALAHTINDWYGNYLQILLPFLVVSGLTVSRGAFLVTMFTITSSLTQPIIGYYVDKKNISWLVYVGTIWMAVILSFVGLVKSYPLLLIMVVVAGLGTAAYHPTATALVSSYSGHRRGLFQSVFSSCGNLGIAFVPLLLVPIIQKFGLDTPIVYVIFLTPGLLGASLLLFATPGVHDAPLLRKTKSPPIMDTLRKAGRDILSLFFMVALRSFCYYGLMAFLPLYLLQVKGMPLITGSKYLSAMLFAGVAGGLLGGFISDIIGRKPVIIGSLVLATPLYYLFLNSSGFLAYVIIVIAGALIMASFPVGVVFAQERLKDNVAMASGLMTGFMIGFGGIGVGLVGVVTEQFGISAAINMLIICPVLAGLAILPLKDYSGKKFSLSSLKKK